MPQIPEFRRRQLASEITGSPGRDRSGEIIGRSIEKFGQQLFETTSDIAQRRARARSVAQASKALVDFDVTLEKEFQNHKRRFSENPEDKTDLFQDRTNQLLDSKLAEIENPQAQQIFSSQVFPLIRQRLLAETKWASKQQGILAFNDVTEGINTLAGEARKAGQEGDLGRVDDILSKAQGLRIAQKLVLSDEQNQEAEKLANKSISTGAILGVMDTDPEQAAELLREGEFSKVFSPEETQEFIEDAIDAADRKERKAEKELTKKQETNAYKFSARILDPRDNVNPQEIKDAAEIGDLSPEAAVNALRMLRDEPPSDSDIQVVADLNIKSARGELTIQDILDNQESLNEPDRRKYLDSITADISANPAVKRAVETYESFFERDLLTGAWATPEDAEDVARGVEEIIDRSVGGQETPTQVLRELIERRKMFTQNKFKFVNPDIVRELGGVSLENIETLRKKIADRVESGKMTVEEAKEEFIQLQKLEETL